MQPDMEERSTKSPRGGFSVCFNRSFAYTHQTIMKTSILVTGGAGFVGSHVADMFASDGASVHVIDNLSTGTRHNLPAGVHFHEMDLASHEAAKLIAAIKPELIIHLAANSRVRASLKDPIFDYVNNTVATMSLLDAATRSGLKHLIFFSTGGAIYGDKDTLPITEDDPTSPDSFYGISKLTAEKVLWHFARSSPAVFTILRPSNIYGERQRPDLEAGVISIFINRMLEGDNVVIFGDGNQTRDFIYVSDVVSAVKHVADKRLDGVYNVSTGVETSINLLFEKLAGMLGYDKDPVREKAIPGELRRNVLSPAKLKSTGWKHRISLDVGLHRTIKLIKETSNR